ncbi:MAG: sulfurtransferase TusA family protein [Anaerolineae bacterium]
MTPNKTLDARGLQCPMPIVKTSKEIKSLEVGEILEVLATDPASVADIQAWSKSTGNELMHSEKDDGIFRFYIKRTN